MNPGHSVVASERFLRQRLNHDPVLVEFAASLLAGVRHHRPELDQMLADRAQNWSLRRMAVTDRNVLRLGVYEMLFTDTPSRVAINEAVDLARRFGAGQSAQFVNGILDRFLKEARQQQQQQRPAESEPAAPEPPPQPAGPDTP